MEARRTRDLKRAKKKRKEVLVGTKVVNIFAVLTEEGVIQSYICL